MCESLRLRALPHPPLSSAEAVTGTRVAITGWALDPVGISGVAVHVDGVAHAATIGIARSDVAQAKPGFPDSARAGFTFDGDFADLSPQRHVDRAGAQEPPPAGSDANVERPARLQS